MPIDDRTTNRSYQLPNASNLLSEDVARLRTALSSIDADVFARYTKVEVNALINDLIQGAPGALNTLNELAAAMGNDPNFAATVTNALAMKANSDNVYSKAESDARYVQGQVQIEMVFIATANQSVFTLTTGIINKPSALVTVDGVVQPTSEYSLNQAGTQLTLSEGVPAGTVVRVLAMGIASVGAPADDTVTTPKLRDGALEASTAGLAKMADGFFSATVAALAKFADGFFAATTAGRAKMADGFVTPAKLSQPLTLMTAQATTSGTNIDFTGIPSWVRRVTLMFNGVSTSGSSFLICQIGSGSIITANYNSYVNTFDSGPTGRMFTNGIGLNEAFDASQFVYGHVVLTKLSDHNWTASVTLASTVGVAMSFGAGSVSLPGSLDRLRITTASTPTGSTFGIDTFDAGSINVLYE